MDEKNKKDRTILDILIEKTLEIILEFDENGTILRANRTAEETLGYFEDIIGLNISNILKKDYEECNSNISAVADGLLIACETILYRQNRTCFRAQVKIEKDETSGRNYFFALDTEVSREMEHEVARVKEKSDQAIKARNEFVANVTHELRTPVNGIKGHVENLKETYLSTEQRKTLDIIVHCCNNMSSIINNILDFSKLESGKIELEEREFNFREMMQHVVETNMAAVNEKGLQLNLNIDENIPDYLIGDELRLTQILNNLLSNAVKFTSVGFIKIEAAVTIRYNDEIELFFMVIDSGIGISEQEQDKLFKSFTQVDSSITRKYGGTGLGLAITKELVELMKGKTYIESRKGNGSNFSFSVRLHSKETSTYPKEYREEVMQFFKQVGNRNQFEQVENYYKYGSDENNKEIKSRMEILILCIELGAWDKAEMWSGELKKLVENADAEIKRNVLRLEMAVRKGNYETSVENFEKVKRCLDGTL